MCCPVATYDQGGGTVTEIKNEVKLHELLQKLYDSSLENLDEDQADELYQLLLKNQRVFSKGDFDLGKTDVAKHSIDTGDTPPFREPVRRLPVHKYAEAQKCVQDMLEQGVIEPSNSPLTWLLPIGNVKWMRNLPVKLPFQ
jgi:hypothetical protein